MSSSIEGHMTLTIIFTRTVILLTWLGVAYGSVTGAFDLIGKFSLTWGAAAVFLLFFPKAWDGSFVISVPRYAPVLVALVLWLAFSTTVKLLLATGSSGSIPSSGLLPLLGLLSVLSFLSLAFFSDAAPPTYVLRELQGLQYWLPAHYSGPPPTPMYLRLTRFLYYDLNINFVVLFCFFFVWTSTDFVAMCFWIGFWPGVIGLVLASINLITSLAWSVTA